MLIVAYYFPPQTSVGVFRTTKFIDHFKENDIDAAILTVKNPDSKFHPSQGDQLDEYQGFPVHYAREIPTKWLWKMMTVFKKRLSRLSGKSFDEGLYASKWWYIDMEYGWILPSIIKGYKIIRQYKPAAMLR